MPSTLVCPQKGTNEMGEESSEDIQSSPGGPDQSNGPGPNGSDQGAEALRKLNQIMSQVSRFFGRRSGVDVENLACDIWLESFEKHRDVTSLFIRSRCIDEIRRRVRKRAQALVNDPGSDSQRSEEAKRELLEILEGSSLSAQEVCLIFHRYYQGRTNEQIAELLNLSPPEVSKRFSELLSKLRRTSFLVFGERRSE